MATISRTGKLAADPKRVMSYLSDVQNHPAFISALKSVKNLSGDSHKVGTHWDWTFVMAAVEVQGTAETVAYEPDKRFVFRTSGGIDSTFTYSVEPDGNGSQLTIGVVYDLPSGVLAKVADKAVFERHNEAQADRTAANIKAIFED